MRKIIIVFLLLLIPISGCSSSNGDYDYDRIEYPIELSKTINSVLEKEDAWECDGEFCIYEFKNGSVAKYWNEDDKDNIVFLIESDVFEWNVQGVNYNVVENKLKAIGSFHREEQWCELTDEPVCKVDSVNLSEDGLNIIMDFRDYILDLLYDYITNLN